jgi:hypothetical protein
VFLCLCFWCDDAWTTVRAASDDERSTNEPDARWRRCEELRTSQCVVSHTAPFSPPLGVCHVVTCFCFLAFVGMFLSSFLFASYFIYCMMYVCMCVYIYIYNYHNMCVNIVRASNLRWPELFGQGPGAVRQGRTNCELGVARASAGLEHI